MGDNVSEPDKTQGTVYTWYDDYCFQCQMPVKRELHKVTGHRLLSNPVADKKVRKPKKDKAKK